MKVRNQNSKQSYDSELKGPVTSDFKLWLCISCFAFLPFCLLAVPTGTVSANSATDVSQKLPQNSFAVPRDPNNRSESQLWQAWISVANDEKDGKSRNELKQIIEQIRSVEFKPQKQVPKAVVVTEPAPAIEPNETLADTAVRKELEKKEPEHKLPYGLITGQTLQMLRNLSQHPDKLDNPFELGEVLFLSGNPREAAVFYRQALNRISPDDVTSARDRAWILFQMGNSLWGDDPPEAAKMYGQLITEYPDSPWVDLAKAQRELIGWYQKDEPHKLVAEYKP